MTFNITIDWLFMGNLTIFLAAFICLVITTPIFLSDIKGYFSYTPDVLMYIVVIVALVTSVFNMLGY